MGKKLIEVALPLEAINNASALEKGNPFLKGHPRSLHQWWARRPLAAARAVIFSQMIDDPTEYVETLLSDAAKKRAATRELAKRRDAWNERTASYEAAMLDGDSSVPAPGPEPTLEACAADIERERLFEIIRKLVLWENTTNEAVLQQARDEIWQSWRRACAENADHPRAKELFDRHKLPAFHDPFAGGGSIPLEAQRLGLEAHASDLNPVAVLINKAMIEIPPKFAGQPPVNPEARKAKSLLAREWKGAQGLAEDVRYYGQWMRDEAEKRIGHLYPKVEVTAGMATDRPDLKPYVGKKLTVIAWIWARTVKSPNPAFAHVDVPLASTFMLSTKPGKESYVEPVVEHGGYWFTVRTGKPTDPETAKKGTKFTGANFICVMSGVPIGSNYIKAEGKTGRMGARLMAIVAETDRGRVYLTPTETMEAIARQANPDWKPEVEFFQQALGFRVGNYGMTKWSDLFTSRQLVALATLSDLVQEVRERARRDATAADMSDTSNALAATCNGAAEYADAIAVIQALAVDKLADYNNTLCTWNATNQHIRALYNKQTVSMAWDFSELSPIAGGLSFDVISDGTARSLDYFPANCPGDAFQINCSALTNIHTPPVISTDPPYYDNIGYADLSDFFYVWLRRSLQPVFPDLFATLTTPKAEELVATPARHGSKERAETFFLDGMKQAMHRLADQGHPSFPVTIYYAFKQSESDGHDGTASTGWETFLEAVIRADLAISGTWPVRTERITRMRGLDSNALASSIVLVCRPKGADAPTATYGQFRNTLKMELPSALAHLQRGNIAPVDLAQAAIGPGMAVYTRHAKVLDAQGRPLSVRQALALINETLDEALAEQEGDFDDLSRWALAWLGDHGFADGPFGDAHTYFLRFNTAENALISAGIIRSGRGKVRLLKPNELSVDWNPATDRRLTVWEIVHHLIRVLEAEGESAAAMLVAKLGAQAETARELCYRLYTVCERKKRAVEALSYNGLVQSWPEITRLARESVAERDVQPALF